MKENKIFKRADKVTWADKIDQPIQASIIGVSNQLPRSGHPRFYDLTRAEEELHTRKNSDYAGGGRPMGNFERVGKIMEMYPGFPLNTPYGVGIMYMMKQLDAVLWLLATNREGGVETVGDRLGDMSVYAKLIRIMYEERIK